jgi:hypothetical protein
LTPRLFNSATRDDAPLWYILVVNCLFICAYASVKVAGFTVCELVQIMTEGRLSTVLNK